jgi:uncharacterized protein (TIGR03382 family)
MGVDGELEGVGARFGPPERFHENLGCDATGRGNVSVWGLALVGLLTRRRQANATSCCPAASV